MCAADADGGACLAVCSTSSATDTTLSRCRVNPAHHQLTTATTTTSTATSITTTAAAAAAAAAVDGRVTYRTEVGYHGRGRT